MTGWLRKVWSGGCGKAGTFVCDNAPAETPSVGFFYFKEAESVMAKAAELLQAHVAKAGFDLKIIPFEADYYGQVDLLEEAQAKGLKGAIAVMLDNLDCKRAVLRLEENQFPHVRFGNSFFSGKLKSPLVRGDDAQAINDGIAYLRKFGHGKIGLICDFREKDYARQRDMLVERGILSPDCCLNVEFSLPDEEWPRFPGRQMARGYLEEHPELTALVVEFPIVAIEFLRQATLMGRKVPEDLSLLALRDAPGLRHLSPPLTTLGLAWERMTEVAAAKLVEVMRDGLPKREEIIRIEYMLKERASVAAPRVLAEAITAR